MFPYKNPWFLAVGYCAHCQELFCDSASNPADARHFLMLAHGAKRRHCHWQAISVLPMSTVPALYIHAGLLTTSCRR